MQEEEAGAVEYFNDANWCLSGADGDKPLCSLSVSTSNRFQALAGPGEGGFDAGQEEAEDKPSEVSHTPTRSPRQIDAKFI